MDKLFKVLYIINNNEDVTQRDLSDKGNLSIGGVNGIIKQAEQEGYITIERDNKRTFYKLTRKGINFLEEYIHEGITRKIKLHDDKLKIVKQAVILAAGEKKEFGKPVAFLDLEDKIILDRIIELLIESGIEKIVIVTGYKKEYYEQYVKGKSNIFLVDNNKYKWTGTMASLSLVKDIVDDDFLLIENDLVFEERAIKEILKNKNRDCMVITSESGSGDEALVEIRDGYIYKMSKDIHQFNKIDGEMIGISKISYEVFCKMLEQYNSFNKNPYLNYEYALMDIGREYRIGYTKIDDLVWTEVDSVEHYEILTKRTYNRILRKEKEVKISEIKSKLSEILDIEESCIHEIEPAGGMTNKNYKVNINGVYYILRIPGNGTEDMISRINEKNNSKMAHKIDIDTEILYFDENSGIKISKLINNAETLNPKTAKREDNMELISNILRTLHNSEVEFYNKFDVFKEIEKYEKLLEDANGDNFEDYKEIKSKVLKLDDILDKLGKDIKPCHNDTVPENFVKGDGDRIYLIDWEYSGTNDPMWDLSAHIIECNFTEDEEELFLQKYFQTENIDEKYKTKILIYKICQDFLWSIWTNIKEAKGDDFGTYGVDRYNRAKENLKKILN